MSITFRELIKAVLNDDIDNLRQYLENGLDADFYGENKITALMMAAKKETSRL